MRLRHVQTMLALVEAGTIRAAAVRLGKTQSALTKQLKQMEDELGLSLFHRSSRGISPTEIGLSLLSRAKSIQSEIDRFDQEVSALRGKQTGSIRVSAAPLAAIKILPRAIARFRKEYPDIDISISSDLFGDAMKGLREGQHDIIIGPHAGAEDLSDVEAESLFTTEVVLITSKHAPHANATSLEDLTGCYWAMIGGTTGAPRQRFQEQFTRNGLVPPRIRLASESRLGLLSIIETTDAVCTYPLFLLDEISAHRNIVRIQIREALNPLSISLITRAGQSLTPAGEAFADCIRHRADVVTREWQELET